jgi:prepilin-type N-terminal cleavage/methylation domain-containing protein
MRAPIHTQQKGFTLLETLVAVFILTLALTGPIYIASLAIRGSVESRDNISAYHLAEEAIEVIRNRRDNISLQSSGDETSWIYNIVDASGCVNSATESSIKTCYMTRDTSGIYTFTACGSGGCPPLVFDPEGSIIYGATGLIGASNSKFTREVYIQVASQDGSTNAEPNREIDVVVTIRWPDRGTVRKFQVIERLHNQQYSKYYIE